MYSANVRTVRFGPRRLCEHGDHICRGETSETGEQPRPVGRRTNCSVPVPDLLLFTTVGLPYSGPDARGPFACLPLPPRRRRRRLLPSRPPPFLTCCCHQRRYRPSVCSSCTCLTEKESREEECVYVESVCARACVGRQNRSRA